MRYPMSRCTTSLILIWMIIALTGCVGVQNIGRDGTSNALESVSWPRPTFLTSAERQTVPGLSVVYSYNKIRHIDNMPDSKSMEENGVPGRRS